LGEITLYSPQRYIDESATPSAVFPFIGLIDLELSIDPAPRGDFRDYDFLIPYDM